MTLEKKKIGNWGGSVAVRINGFNASEVSGISEGSGQIIIFTKGE